MLYIRILCLLLVAVLFVHTVIASPGTKLKALYKEGITCMKAGHFEDALRCFQQVIRQDGNYTAAYLRIGDVYLAINNIQAAEEQFRSVLQRDPRNSEALYAMGILYFNTKDFPAAVKAFEQSIACGYKPDADYHLNKGIALLQVKDTSNGVQHLQSCLLMNPGETRALQSLAHVSYTSGLYEEAISYWNRLLLLQPGNAFALFMLGKSHISNGNTIKGEELCNKALEMP